MYQKIVKSKIFSYQKLLDIRANSRYDITLDEVLNYDDIPRKSEVVENKTFLTSWLKKVIQKPEVMQNY
ncbi:MAG: hypothetical protein CVU99_06135 [Firmicutes bacterium HGW-Firmicutes-4]|jgi:fructose-bisphosphate aldolase class II|nr:MAG: hypothetical protein CVU99_06135 [Firmicutes bacterium HGW-Firmicutes-4]